jgi:hypothetical protein
MAVTIDQGPMDGPDTVGPDYSPKRTFGEHLRHIGKAFTTKDGLIGNYDYGNYPPEGCPHGSLKLTEFRLPF